MKEFDLTPENVMETLLDRKKLKRLIKAIKPKGAGRLRDQYEDAVRECKASTDQLREAVRLLLEPEVVSNEGVRSVLMTPLLFHPQIPEETLLHLYEKDLFELELAHTRSSRALLERIAEERRISEAVTTLALTYYGAASADDEEFARFVTKYKDDYMLRYNLRNSWMLPAEKKRIAVAIIGEKDGV